MRWSSWTILGVAFTSLVTTACRRDEPPPSHHEDLGDDSQPLLPTSPTWKDDRVVGGDAEFHPLREPKAGGEGAGAGSAEQAGGAGPSTALQGELAGVVKEHNEALAGGSAEEVSDFYVEAQIESVQSAVVALTAARDKVRELAVALPDKKDDLERLAVVLSPDTLLRLEIGAVQPKGDEEATGALGRTPPVAVLPSGPSPEGAPREVTFRKGDGDWYIDSPLVRLAGEASATLNEMVGALDAVIADAKAGTLTADGLAERSPALAQMLERMPPPGEAQEPSEGEQAPPEEVGEPEEEAPAEEDGAAESDNAPEPD